MTITSVAVSETSPASRTRETLESALLKSPSPDNNNVVDEKQTFSVVDDEKKKKSQLPVAYVAEPVDVNKATEVAILVESKGTETEEDDLIENELQSKLEGADATVIEKDSTPEVEKDDVIIIRKEVDDSVVIIIQAAIRGFLVWSCFLSL